MLLKKQKTENQLTGDLGEKIAADFFESKGFVIRETNYRKKWGEIDIIVQKGNNLRFIEVKTVIKEKILPGDYEPEDNIHPWKLRRLSRAIQIYLLDKNIDEDRVDWQLDSIAVYLNQNREILRIEQLEDIF